MIRFCSNILFLFYYTFINLFIKIINLINDDCVLVKKNKKNGGVLVKSWGVLVKGGGVLVIQWERFVKKWGVLVGGMYSK